MIKKLFLYFEFLEGRGEDAVGEADQWAFAVAMAEMGAFGGRLARMRREACDLSEILCGVGATCAFGDGVCCVICTFCRLVSAPVALACGAENLRYKGAFA